MTIAEMLLFTGMSATTYVLPGRAEAGTCVVARSAPEAPYVHVVGDGVDVTLPPGTMLGIGEPVVFRSDGRSWRVLPREEWSVCETNK